MYLIPLSDTRQMIISHLLCDPVHLNLGWPGELRVQVTAQCPQSGPGF